MSSIRRKDMGLLVLVVLIASSLVFASMGYYYNTAGGVVINKVYAQEELGIIDEEPTTAGGVVVDESPTTEEQQPPAADVVPEEGEGGVEEQPTPGQTITATTEEGQQPLTASISRDSTNGDNAPATFLFETDPEGGTEPYTYSWDFGDGQQSNEQIMTHTFQNPGTYQITLIVTDSAGQTASDTEQVTVQPAVPLTAVEIFANSTEGVAPATFEFTADIFREETRAFTFSWDFGDDSQQGSGEVVTHTYQNPGTYTVTVTVAHPTTGQTVTDTEQVTVQPMTTTTEGQQLATTNATELRRPPPPREMTIGSTVVVNALLSALVALSPPSSPLPTNDSLQEEQVICTDDGGGMNVTCPDVIMIIRGGELLRCWDEEEDDRPGSYTEVICPGGEIEIPKNMPQLGPPVGGPKEMTID